MNRVRNACVLAAVVTVLIAGCGGDEPESSPAPAASEPAAAPTQAATQDAQVPASAGSATLTFDDGTTADIPEMITCTFSPEDGFALEGEGPYDGKLVYFRLIDNPDDPDFADYKRSYKLAYESDFDGWRSAPGYVVSGRPADPDVTTDSSTVTVSVELDETSSQGLIPAMNGGGQLAVAADCSA